MEARSVEEKCKLKLKSECELIQAMAERLTEVDPYREISYRGVGPETMQKAAECRLHPACPVPAGIIKAIEVSCGLALPMDAHIKFSESDTEA